MKFKFLFLSISFILAAPACKKSKAINSSAADNNTKKIIGLLEARAGFTTQVILDERSDFGPAPVPPANIFKLVHYPAAEGALAAYVSPDPKDGKKHPAIVWAHGGAGGIGENFWEKPEPGNDQSAQVFRQAGIIMMIPSWVGENDNPGVYSYHWAQLGNALKAAEYLATLPYVDTTRIYMAGHSTGGTVAMQTAVAPSNFKAVFAYGGIIDITKTASFRKGAELPFDLKDPQQAQEAYLRSPINFIGVVKAPTFYFEGAESQYVNDVQRLSQLARAQKLPIQATIIKGGTHFNILAPINALIAQKIVQEWQNGTPIKFEENEAQQAFDKMLKGQ